MVLKSNISRFQDHGIKRVVSLGSKIMVLKSNISRFQDHGIKELYL